MDSAKPDLVVHRDKAPPLARWGTRNGWPSIPRLSAALPRRLNEDYPRSSETAAPLLNEPVEPIGQEATAKGAPPILIQRPPAVFPRRRAKDASDHSKQAGEEDVNTSRIKDLEARIRVLEGVKRRSRNEIRRRVEELKDSRGELTAARNELFDTQKEVDRLEETLGGLKVEVEKWRRWWLNEYHFVKLLLNLIPNSADIHTIAASSHARYKAFCATLET
ncbi:hypothetical protein DFP72DRAFT_1066853 [Ephemerocybe angulata]|uniref:Uncharacterized protein n=1 Tax=Ephemerocybe angulata TaxID=980116 RepID=A0A8H6I0Q2_9AGAR|nr:hypothetical protein DFP72DRAFT_1066853 [Tulosesus angulatus]